jgi:hypothetical protein
MNSYKDPNAPLIANPVNLDRPIQTLQLALAAGLPWLQKAYGRAYESVKRDQAGNKIIYPQVWQGPGLDLLEVMPNDNLVAQSFFKVEDPVEAVEFRPDGFSTMRARVSLIVWFNLQMIDSTIDYSYGEVLKADIQRVLSRSMIFEPGDSIKVLRIWETAKNVFNGYTLTEISDQNLVYPCGGFRFECDLTFIENC